MVPILVLLTFAAMIGVGLLLQGRRAGVADSVSDGAPALAPAFATNGGDRSPLYLHPGHAWVRLLPDGYALAGPSAFAANFTGALASVEAPAEGTRLRQGDPAWTLVAGARRRLTQPMPVDGEIVGVNRALLEDPARMRAADAGEDWLLKIRPARLSESLNGLFGGAMAEAWREVSTLRLNAILSPALGRVANDGGQWVANFGDLLTDDDWTAARDEIFPKGVDGSREVARHVVNDV
ncbi:MAG: glycine cleavage system protein H [Hyphomicrobiales bacterium]